VSPYREAPVLPRRSRWWRFRLWLTHLVAPVEVSVSIPSDEWPRGYYARSSQFVLVDDHIVQLPMDHDQRAVDMGAVCPCDGCRGVDIAVVRSGPPKMPKAPPPIGGWI
jgi:hypothetical protein